MKTLLFPASVEIYAAVENEKKVKKVITKKVGKGWKKVKRVHRYLSNKTLLICIKFHLYFGLQELRRHY